MKQLQGSGILFAGAAAVLLAARPVWAQATQVTAVQLSPTNRGFNVVLGTSTGDRPQILTTKQGNALVADIINTQLRLPQGNSFRRDNPAPGIASVVITQTDPNSVRMVVTGTTSAPSSQIAQRNAQEITLSISRASGTAALPRLTPSTPPAFRNTPAVNAGSRQPAAATRAPAQRQPRQTPTAQRPNVLVPNPKVTIDGKPAPAAGTAQPVNPAPPLLPRAIAPPVGDIAVSNSDASPSIIDLGTTERVPRLVLRDAPVREVLALLARAAGLNLAFSTTTPSSGGQGQPDPNAAAGAANEGPRISLDIEDESVQDVFNYVLRISGLQANRSGRTIFVGVRLTNQARDVIVRSFRLNQVTVGVALNFLVAMGAESAVSRERTITSVNAVPVGGTTTPATQTQTSTETRIETQRIDFQDSVPLLRGLQIVGDERTNSVTLIGSPKQIDIATTQLIQIDARRRQVAVNIKIVDVNLLATDNFNTSFSFGIGDTFFTSDNGAARLNFGGVNPPSVGQVDASVINPPVITNPYTGEPFSDRNNQINVPLTNPDPGGSFLRPIPPFGEGGRSDPLTPGISEYTPFDVDPTTGEVTPGDATFSLPTLFQFPSRFLSRLQAQVTSGNAKILTDPTLTVQEGQNAQLNLTAEVLGGTETVYITANQGGNAIPTTRPIIKEAGLTVLIRIERIDDNGFISLSVAPSVSAPASTVTSANGDSITLLNERSLTSGLIRLRDGQTLILSGIIQDQDQTTVSKVPILGDIPILGALFRSSRRVNQRNEVVVLLTPQILDDSAGSSFGYNYTPGQDVRQILERQRGSQQVPGNNSRDSSTGKPSP